MQYHVRLTERASTDLEGTYDFIEAGAVEAAFSWFNELSEAIYSLEKLPERGSTVPKNKKLHQSLFGVRPDIYRIIYTVEKRSRVVSILHIRHGARAAGLEEQ
jgi:toxin ParE1/3/4